MNREHATYVYCLIESDASPKLARAPTGLPHTSRPRALPAGTGLWLVVADAPLDRYGESGIERGLRDLEWVSRCALAHQKLIEHVGQSRSLRKGAPAAVVPMKLFTLFRSDERALQHIASADRRLQQVLNRVRGCEEYGVRVSLHQARALRLAEAEARRVAGPANSGAGYLMRKKKVQENIRGYSGSARRSADELYEALARKAEDACRRPPVAGRATGSRLVLDAAYLVRRQQAEPFLSAVKRAARALEEGGFELTVTGPWPPYNFIAGAA